MGIDKPEDANFLVKQYQFAQHGDTKILTAMKAIAADSTRFGQLLDTLSHEKEPQEESKTNSLLDEEVVAKVVSLATTSTLPEPLSDNQVLMNALIRRKEEV
eukprot:CAMPEP_0170484960 /NCGR_PEP_ID=MMETSP0208-20121228/4334_1 /TAXON_ID=197538 /ORGANISM="Strombidium inclinatum, Strain S3" /LENGTH=101 /DNA_ID=CAMNT_0010758461 /DNA_START=597 /DNA_END=902 /DNA_ORIENTATION=-